MSFRSKSRTHRSHSKTTATGTRNHYNCDELTSKHITPDEMTSQDFYIDENSHFRTHEKLLRDKITMTAYINAINHNQHLFKGKIVLDVGCGIGILSMLAAKAGASKVIAYDNSKIAHHTKKIIASNNLTAVITVVCGAIDNVQLPKGIDKVDIIISKWMGYCLFFKSHLDNVLFARDNWLKPNGLMFPDRCSLFIAAIEHRHNKNGKINWWDNVYGFNMDVFRQTTLSEPITIVVDSKHVVTDAFLIKEIDLYELANTNVFKFSSNFQLTAFRDDYVQAFITYFNVEFTKSHKWIGFSTSPETTYTHWGQTIFYLDRSLTVKKGEQIHGKFSLNKYKNNCDLNIKIKVKFTGKLSNLTETNHYKMC